MPTPKPPRRKFRPKVRTYVLDKHLTGALEGAHVVMASMSARDMIRLRSGEMTEGEVMEFTAQKVIEHDIDVPDIRDVDAEDFLAIANAWNAAVKDQAVPPVQGDS